MKTHKPLVIDDVTYDPSHIQCVHEEGRLSRVVFHHDEEGWPIPLHPDTQSRYRSAREVLTDDKKAGTNWLSSRWEQTVCNDHLPLASGAIRYEPELRLNTGKVKKPDFVIGDDLVVECFVLERNGVTSHSSHLGPGEKKLARQPWSGLGWELYRRMVNKLEPYRHHGCRLVLAIDDMDSIGDICVVSVLCGDQTPALEIDTKTGDCVRVFRKNMWLDPAHREEGVIPLYPNGLFEAFPVLLAGVLYRELGQPVILLPNPFQSLGLPEFRNVSTR